MNWKVHLSIATASAMIAGYVGDSTISTRSALVFLVCITTLEAGMAWAMRGLLRRVRDDKSEFDNALRALSQHEAQVRATKALRRGDRCTVRLRAERSLPDQLPEELREFFRDREAVEFESGSFASVEYVTIADGQAEESWEIGRSFDGARVVFRSRDGRVFELDDGETPESTNDDGYPSLYHWIAAELNLVAGMKTYAP